MVTPGICWFTRPAYQSRPDCLFSRILIGTDPSQPPTVDGDTAATVFRATVRLLRSYAWRIATCRAQEARRPLEVSKPTASGAALKVRMRSDSAALDGMWLAAQRSAPGAPVFIRCPDWRRSEAALNPRPGAVRRPSCPILPLPSPPLPSLLLLLDVPCPACTPVALGRAQSHVALHIMFLA